MEITDLCLKKIEKFEGCKLTSYQDSKGIWTIGVGHTNHVQPFQKITLEQARYFLKQDIFENENYINNLKINLTQGQFDALVDFSYNLGIGTLLKSTLLKKVRLNPNDKSIKNEFMKYVYCGGKKHSGLIKRRTWEAIRYYNN